MTKFTVRKVGLYYEVFKNGKQYSTRKFHTKDSALEYAARLRYEYGYR